MLPSLNVILPVIEVVCEAFRQLLFSFKAGISEIIAGSGVGVVDVLLFSKYLSVLPNANLENQSIFVYVSALLPDP